MMNKKNIEGQKLDFGKLRYSLLPFEALEKIVEVLEYGAVKYSEDNWQKVPNFKKRYFNALLRHLFAWWRGEKIDPESGLSHMAHAGCCILFLIWGDR